MSKVTFVLGLAGSGKSHLAEKIRADTGALIFEGTEGDPAIKGKMLQHLASGGSCVIEEIAYCRPSAREAIVSEISSLAPDSEIEWLCFENDLASANWNVQHRTNKQDVMGHLRINRWYHGLYIYAGGARIIPIVRVSAGGKMA